MYRYIENAYICIHKTAMVIQTKQNWTIKKNLKNDVFKNRIMYIQ